ncbi:MAG: phosphatidylglycerol lysyltransferase domain-containing protein, partial [Nitrospira sp.]|nr:phosphatidylglycerol lysyltransferase domain-containing protein [Nitrospira sp.]
RSDVREQLAAHPRLIGGYQEDVIVLASLPDVTAALLARWGSVSLRRLTVDDLPRIAMALAQSGLNGAQSLAAYSPVYHYMSNGLLSYWWMELRGALCLFAQSPDGWFLPLVPLGPDPIEAPLSDAMALVHRWNHGSPVGRIENVPARLVPELERLGYRLRPKEPDYLYRAADLAALAGDRYKSQRSLCNRFEREQSFTAASYQDRDRQECRMLLKAWAHQKHTDGLDGFGAMLLADAESVHEVLWSHTQALRLTGMVVRIHGQVCAYTLGYWLTDETLCVLVEVAHRTYPGLAQYLFRETSRMALSEGAVYINTMDDAGLPGLRRSKQAYHPVMLIASFIASSALEL